MSKFVKNNILFMILDYISKDMRTCIINFLMGYGGHFEKR